MKLNKLDISFYTMIGILLILGLTLLISVPILMVSSKSKIEELRFNSTGSGRNLCLCSVSVEDFLEERNSTVDYLWKISHPHLLHSSHLFGTIHVPARLVLSSLSDKTREAFIESDGVYTEIEFASSEFRQKILECNMLPNGKTIGDFTSDDFVSRLEIYFKWAEEKSGWKIDNSWRNVYPFPDLNWYLIGISTDIVYPRPNKTVPKCVSDNLLLDHYLEKFAYKLGKTTGGVETAEDRCELRRNLPIHEGAKIVNTTLFELEKFMNHNERPILDVLIDEYKKKSAISFDVSDKKEYSMERIFSSNDEEASTKEKLQFSQSKAINNELLIKRNRKMTDKMIEIMTGSPHQKFFFAFGVAHFWGEGSVNDLLGMNGFSVERV